MMNRDTIAKMMIESIGMPMSRSHQDFSRHSKIDDIDLRIIKILNEDGRIPFSQIARQLGVSAGMIRQRYHRLVRDGALMVVAITNPLLMGYNIMATIGVKVNVNALLEIADQIASFEEVIYLVLLTGSYDLLIEIVCRDNDHLLRFLTEKLNSVEGVKDTITFMHLQIVKEVYSWTGGMSDR